MSIDGEVVDSIEAGLLVLIGVASGDRAEQASKLASKVARLRVFDREGRMERSLVDVGGAALCVSQFTLYGDVRRGLRPSFGDAAEPALAQQLYELFCARIEAEGVRVARGRFGGRMSVALVNEGPVTLLLEA